MNVREFAAHVEETIEEKGLEWCLEEACRDMGALVETLIEEDRPQLASNTLAASYLLHKALMVLKRLKNQQQSASPN